MEDRVDAGIHRRGMPRMKALVPDADKRFIDHVQADGEKSKINRPHSHSRVLSLAAILYAFAPKE